MIFLFLANGFEIIEALAPVDMLRRAQLNIKTVGVTGKTVTSSCGIDVTADITIDEFEYSNVDAIILPGGSDGVVNLEKDNRVQQIIDKAVRDNIYICAICAAPSILGNKGLLKNVESTAFPTFMKYLDGAVLSDKYVVTDGKYITARGAGVSVDFGLEIVKCLAGEATAENIRKTIQCQ
ncbi:MAG: DJ-1/PfpI family protein [Eubacterium sp.]|nr:DJ-1/PfpI family protein [Eubacterium sp.]